MNQETRHVHVTLKTETLQRWGDGWSAQAAEPTTSQRIELRLMALHSHLDARQVLGRLLHRTQGDAHLQASTLPHPTWEATAIFHLHGEDTAQAVQTIRKYADEVRSGAHDVPTISVEQSRLFSELGIKVRRDGLFGYARKCANLACDEPAGDECFGNLTAQEAIEGARKRAQVTCSTTCWLDAGADWGIVPTADQLLDKVATSSQFRAKMYALGLITSPDELVPDWWGVAKQNSDAKDLVLAEANVAMECSDYEGDPDAINCEA